MRRMKTRRDGMKGGRKNVDSDRRCPIVHFVLAFFHLATSRLFKTDLNEETTEFLTRWNAEYASRDRVTAQRVSAQRLSFKLHIAALIIPSCGLSLQVWRLMRHLLVLVCKGGATCLSHVFDHSATCVFLMPRNQASDVLPMCKTNIFSPGKFSP